jgi:nitrogen-specific signal transduction histidine kinase
MLTKSLSDAETGYQGFTFEHMLQNSKTCGILLVDAEDKVAISAPDAERVLRLSSTGRSSLTIAELPAAVQSIIRKAQTSGKMAVGRQVLSQSGTTGTASVTVTAIPATPNLTVVVLEEILSAKTVEQNLRRLDRLASAGTLSTSMAHEIKNALVAVRTFVDLLLEKNQDPEFGGTVRREMTRVDAIVTHMLRFAAPAQPEFSTLHCICTRSWSIRCDSFNTGWRPSKSPSNGNSKPRLISSAGTTINLNKRSST